MEYRHDDGACVPLRVHTVVVSVQHSEDVTLPEMREQVMTHIIKARLPPDMHSLDS